MDVATTSRRRAASAGFTLLEIMLAAAILILITAAVSRFTLLTVQSADFSNRASEESLACNGLRRLLAAELGALPISESGSLVGMNIKTHNGRRDALQLVCPAGNGLLTPDAKGYYQVTLILREVPRGSGKLFLGLEREPWTDDDDDEDAPAGGVPAKTGLHPGAAEKLPSDWIPIMAGVRQLEIAYFDARLSSWVDRWTDQTQLPSLVRVRLTLQEGQPPYEIVERVPGGGVLRLAPNFNATVPTGARPGSPVPPISPPAHIN